jgi:O-antigen/teichoic acid export membrane protein
MANSLKEQGLKAFIWDFTGKIAIQGIGFVISIFLARLLEPADFGTIAMIMVILGIAGIFSDIGLGGALVQRKRVLPVHYSSVFYFNVFVASILTILTFLSAPLIADFYNNQKLVLLTQVLSISFVLGAVNSVHIVQFRKNLNFKALTKINFTASVISGFIGVVLAFNGFGVWSLVFQQLISSIVTIALVWRFSKWRPQLFFSFKALYQLWGFGFRMFLSGILDSIFTRLDYMIIGRLFSPAVLGFFQRAKALDMLVISYASGSLMGVLFPVLSKVKNDLPRFQSIVLKALGIICFVTLFLLGFLFLVSEELIVMLFTDKWLPSVEYFKILVLSGLAYPVSALLVNVLSSRGNSKAFLRLEIYKKIVASINLYIGFLWGIEGYLYGLIFASSLAVYFNIWFAAKEIDLPQWKFIKPIILQIIIGIISTVVVWYLNKNLDYIDIINFLIKGFEFTLLYIGLNHTFKVQSYFYFLEQFKVLLNKVVKR